MSHKILYLGEKIIFVTSGADQVNKRNQELLEEKFNVTYLPLVKGCLHKVFLGIVNPYLKEIDNMLSAGIYKYVFVPQSLFGRACKHIKNKFPKIKIITFFHNIEVYYAAEYRKINGLKAFPFYLATKYWETQCCKYTDYCITLNMRDSRLLKDIYNKEAVLELPTSFKDNFNEARAIAVDNNTKYSNIDFLFVGVAFFANTEAVQWFIDNVMPRVKGNFYVIGKGMDKYPFQNMSNNVHIYGFVNDLTDFYYRARMVVLPIHVGGGMKTKTAEALMYSKTILGSKEAFEGYEIDKQCMYLCETAEDYINRIESLSTHPTKINPASRDLFKKHYSNNALRKKFNSFITTIHE